MKGFVRVYKSDLLAAIIGFEMRLDAGKEIRDKGIKIFYDKKYNEMNRFNKWLYRNHSAIQFTRDKMAAFDRWPDVLHVVLTQEECDELEWWCWTHKSKVDSVKALYKATADDYALVDQDMAAFVTKHKNYLEGLR